MVVLSSESGPFGHSTSGQWAGMSHAQLGPAGRYLCAPQLPELVMTGPGYATGYLGRQYEPVQAVTRLQTPYSSRRIGNPTNIFTRHLPSVILFSNMKSIRKTIFQYKYLLNVVKCSGIWVWAVDDIWALHYVALILNHKSVITH